MNTSIEEVAFALCVSWEAPKIRTLKSTTCASKKNKTFHRKAFFATFHSSTHLFDTCAFKDTSEKDIKNVLLTPPGLGVKASIQCTTLSKIYMRITSRAIAIFLNYTDLQRTLYAFIAAETILLHLLVQVAECLIAKNGVPIEGQV